jgi:hypothetical protein
MSIKFSGLLEHHIPFGLPADLSIIVDGQLCVKYDRMVISRKPDGHVYAEYISGGLPVMWQDLGTNVDLTTGPLEIPTTTGGIPWPYPKENS